MKTRRLFLTTILTVAAWVVIQATAFAAGATVRLAKTKVEAVDLTNLTFTVTVKATNLVVFITPDTRFFKAGKSATSKDLTVGETVHGTLRKAAEARREAVRIYLGDEAGK